MKKRTIVVCLVLVLVMVCGSASAVLLKIGSYGLDPLYLQMRLSLLGYDTVEVTGDYDDATADAVSRFQERNGLAVTGMVDDETWNMLFGETYRLGISLGGISSRDYYIQGKLTAPFSSVEVVDNPYGNDNQATMKVDSFQCDVFLVTEESLDEKVKRLQEADRATFNDQFVTGLEGKDFKVSDDQTFQINGKQARVWLSSWEFTEEIKMNFYLFRGVVEMDKVDGKQTLVTVRMYYSLLPSQKDIVSSLGIDLVKEVLGNVRCDRDRMAEYKAGAADRKKASKLNITLPEFQPVDENEQSILEMVYTIRDNVNPAADGLSGKLDANTCVSLYYGAKIMQEYVGIVENGNKPSDAKTLCLLSLANGAFDDGFIASAPKIRNRLSAALRAANLALTKEAAPYLVLLGIETPRWTAEELDGMYESLIGSMDNLIERNRDDYDEDDFENDILIRGDWMRAPEIESVAQTGDGEVEITWTLKAEADAYVVYLVEGKEKSPKQIVTGATSCTLKDIPIGNHGFTVLPRKTVNGENFYGYFSETKTLTVVDGWKVAPVLDSVAQTGDGEVTITWTPRAKADAYVVYLIEGTKKTPKKIVTGATTCKLTGLSLGSYGFAVLPRNTINGENVYGNYSETKKLTVVDGWKLAPDIDSIKQTGDGEVTITWTPKAKADAYVVYLIEGTEKTPKKIVTGATTCKLTGLSIGSYGFAVLPRNTIDGKNVYGNYSETKKLTVIDGWKLAPVIDSVEQTGDGEVTVTWTPKAKADAYVVYLIEGTEKTPKKIVTETTCKLTGLSAGSYGFAILPRNTVNGENKYGNYSDTVSLKVIDGWKLAPVIDSVTQTGEGEVEIVWTPKAKADAYVVYLVEGTKKTPKQIVTGATTCKLTGLSLGTYGFMVLPRNTVNGESVYGNYSDMISLKIIEGWKLPPDIESIRQTGKGTVEITWKPKVKADAYVVYLVDGKDKTPKKVVNGDTKCTLTGITAGSHGFAVLPRKTIDEENVYGLYSDTVTLKVTE